MIDLATLGHFFAPATYTELALFIVGASGLALAIAAFVTADRTIDYMRYRDETDGGAFVLARMARRGAVSRFVMKLAITWAALMLIHIPNGRGMFYWPISTAEIGLVIGCLALDVNSIVDIVDRRRVVEREQHLVALVAPAYDDAALP